MNRVLFFSFSLICVFQFFFEKGYAAVINAKTCFRDDVASAINLAKNGDTITVPAGICRWTKVIDSQCEYAPIDSRLDGTFCNADKTGKVLSIIGAGVDKTVIIDNVSKDPNWPNIANLIRWSTSKGGVSRISGFTFQGENQDTMNKGMVTIIGNSNQFIFDNNKVVPKGTSGLIFYGDVRGVVSKNTFDLSAANGYAMYIHHNTWNGIGDFGDSSWASPNSLGTSDAIFIESNTFLNNQSVSGFYYALDGWNGSRVTIRNNIFNNVIFGNHGTESGGRQRGQRQLEIYSNIFNEDLAAMGGNLAFVISNRGGVGVVYDNKVNVKNGFLSKVYEMKNMRTWDPYQPWGKCDGSSPWDLSAGRCMDQVGVGYGKLISKETPIPIGFPNVNTSGAVNTDPNYIWNNTVNGVISNGVSSTPSSVVEGRDFYNGIKRPGYVAYSYPHPLAGGSGAPPPPPPPSDTTAPTVTITSKPASVINVTNASIGFSVSDNVGGSGVDRTECSLNGSVFSICLSPISYSNLEFKVHNFQVRGIDKAGNSSAVQSVQFEVRKTTITIDTTAPTVTITSKPASVINVTNASIGFSVSDNVGGSGVDRTECSLNGSVFSICLSPISYSNLEFKVHNFQVRGIDKAGNSSAVQSVQFEVRKTTITIDTTAPTVIFTGGVSDGAVIDQPLAWFFFSASDNPGGSGIKRVECSLDTSAFSICSPNSTSAYYQNISVGAHVIRIRAVDNMGNISAIKTKRFSRK